MKISVDSRPTANDEMFIAFNGPELGVTVGVLKEALDDHFKTLRSRWHYATNTVILFTHTPPQNTPPPPQTFSLLHRLRWIVVS